MLTEQARKTYEVIRMVKIKKGDGFPTAEQVAEVDRLNARYPVGTKVIFYPGPRSMGGRECSIRRQFGLADYTWYVIGWVTGTAGYVLASHIDDLPAEQEVKPNG